MHFSIPCTTEASLSSNAMNYTLYLLLQGPAVCPRGRLGSFFHFLLLPLPFDLQHLGSGCCR